MASPGGSEISASWYNPRTGESTKAGTHKNRGAIALDLPGEKADGNDWMLVLDNATKRFSALGVSIPR